MSQVEVTANPKIGEYLTWLEIDRGALLRNLEKIKMLTLPSAEILAVIKANAYGHGLLEVANTLAKKVTYFGVTSIEEALKLRQNSIEVPILLFGIQFEPQIEKAIHAHITLSVSSLEQAEMIDRVSEMLSKRALVHIKVDTGMGRLGIPLRTAKETIRNIALLKNLQLEGIYTHFPIAEQTNETFTEKQIVEFGRLVSSLSDKGISFAYRHTANSAGIFCHRDSHLNMVRPGLSLYGIYPDPEIKNKIDLEPALHWRTKVILTKTLKAGDSVGYGRTYIAKKETKIAILPIGYSHGYPVALSGKSEVLIRGQRYPVIGRVSMDYIAVQIDDAPVQTGDRATLLGKDLDNTIRAEEIADIAGTIPYEIVTRINPQIPRFCN